jgi:hypothetical protein
MMDFDLVKEPISILWVWAIFPGLPLAFWTLDALRAIGNKLGVLLVWNQIGPPRRKKYGPGSR